MKKIIKLVLFVSFYCIDAIKIIKKQTHSNTMKSSNIHSMINKKEGHRTRNIIKKGAQRFKSKNPLFALSTL